MNSILAALGEAIDYLLDAIGEAGEHPAISARAFFVGLTAGFLLANLF